MNLPIIMHINYMEQGQTVDYLMRKAAAIGYDGIEFRSAPPKELYPDGSLTRYLDDIRTGKERYGIRYTLFGAPGIQPDAEHVQTDYDRYRTFMDAAGERDLLYMNNFMAGSFTAPGAESWEYEKHGYAAANEEQVNAAANVCRQLADEYPTVRFAFETHMYYIHDRAETARKLTDLINRPNFGINLDYGNAVYFAPGTYLPLEESIDVCGDRLFYTHLKNSIPGTPRRTPVALSQGDINHRAYLKKLSAVGFQGLIGVEAPRSGDREYYAKEDFVYLRELMAEI